MFFRIVLFLLILGLVLCFALVGVWAIASPIGDPDSLILGEMSNTPDPMVAARPGARSVFRPRSGSPAPCPSGRSPGCAGSGQPWALAYIALRAT